jgi:hypothetical protein
MNSGGSVANFRAQAIAPADNVVALGLLAIAIMLSCRRASGG